MFGMRTDLPLDRDASARFLPWIIGFMVYLCVIAVAAGLTVDRVAERWRQGLADHLDALPATLSGGQQQRVAIARAVIARPSLLLADEPTGNVDDVIGLRLMYLFEELNRLGTTVVIATHNDTLVSRFSHRQLRIESSSIRVFDPRPMTGYPAPAQPPAGEPGKPTTQFRRPKRLIELQ